MACRFCGRVLYRTKLDPTRKIRILVWLMCITHGKCLKIELNMTAPNINFCCFFFSICTRNKNCHFFHVQLEPMTKIIKFLIFVLYSFNFIEKCIILLLLLSLYMSICLSLFLSCVSTQIFLLFDEEIFVLNGLEHSTHVIKTIFLAITIQSRVYNKKTHHTKIKKKLIFVVSKLVVYLPFIF